MRIGGNMVDIFKALSEESRLRIISLLEEKEMCVCEIESCLNMTQSNASRHLTTLKKSGILESNKIAQWTYYRIDDNFKVQHSELWKYLCDKLKELPTYQEDKAKCENCNQLDLCNSNSAH